MLAGKLVERRAKERAARSIANLYRMLPSKVRLESPDGEQADLGIALGTGADIAMSAAPVVLVSGALSNVNDAFTLACITARVIRQNLFWAFFYNIAGISLAITGVLSPILAAGAMLLSSSSVVAKSMRLTRNGGRKPEPR